MWQGETFTFDDGSTMTLPSDGGPATATDATYPEGVPSYNRPSASWTPQSVNPRASSWDDVLKFGLARLIDAKSRPLYPENTLPLYGYQDPRHTTQFGAPAAAAANLWGWAAVAGVVVVGLMLANKAKA